MKFRFSFMLRIGRWMVTQRGLFRYDQVSSVSGKIRRYAWRRPISGREVLNPHAVNFQ